MIETAAKMKTAAKAAKAAKDKKARHGQTLHSHKMNMRMNIHTYTHKNNVRTKIYYPHTQYRAITYYLHSWNILTYYLHT